MDGDEEMRQADRTSASDDAPVLYIDGFRVHISPTTITLDIRRSEPWTTDESDRVLAHLQFSPLVLQPFIQALIRADQTYNREMARLVSEGDQPGAELSHEGGEDHDAVTET